MRCWCSCLVMWFGILALPVATAQEYANYRDARRAAAALLSKKDYAGSRVPLEAALALAATPAERLETNEALMIVYREVREPEKLVTAAEFVLRHSDTVAKRSIVARTLASFYLQNGMLPAAIQRYEDTLTKDESDLIALTVLAVVYQSIDRDPQKAAKIESRLTAVNTDIAKARATELERQASANSPQQAALLKDAALAWLEARDTDRALATAEKSLAAPPETRTEILVYYWRMQLGDVFAACGEKQRAIAQYELSVAAIDNAVLKQQPQKKIDELNR